MTIKNEFKKLKMLIMNILGFIELKDGSIASFSYDEIIKIWSFKFIIALFSLIFQIILKKSLFNI